MKKFETIKRSLVKALIFSSSVSSSAIEWKHTGGMGVEREGTAGKIL